MEKEELIKIAKEFSKKIIKIVLIVAIVLVLISGSIYVVQVENGSYEEEDWSNTGFVVKQMALSEVNTQNITQTTDGWAMNIDLDTKVDEIIQKLEEEGGTVEHYISSSNRKEYLKAFIKAELITQYPDLRNANKIGTDTADNEFQGCIQVYRASSSGATEILTYVDYDTFSSYIDNGNSEATKYFTLDESGDLVVAGWTRTTTNVTSNVPEVENISNKVEYTLTTRSVNYKTAVKSYCMPFDFLWALTVMSDDEDFAYNVAQLALKSKIVLTVQDNLSTTITNVTEEYDIQEKVVKKAMFVYKQDPEDEYTAKSYNDESEKTPVHYETKTNTKVETCSVKVNITEADTWSVKYENTVSNSTPDSTSTGPETETIDDTSYELAESPAITTELRNELKEKLIEYLIEKGICDSKEDFNEKEENEEIIARVLNIKHEKYERTINKSTTYESSCTSNKYVLGTPTVTEKTDKESEEENFVTIFTKSKTAKSNILSATEWLFEMLENGEKTANMVDLVKYLLYKATGTDYGVTEYSFKTIDISSTQSVGGSSTENYIKAWENGALWLYETGQTTSIPTSYLTEDGLNYIVYEDGSAGHNNIAYGWATFISSSSVSHSHSEYAHHPKYGDGYWNWRSQFAAEGISVESLSEGALVDKATATAVFQNQILPYFRNKVDDYLSTYLPEYEFSRAQKDALISICYQYGNISGFNEAYISSLNADGTVNAEMLKANYSRFNYKSTVNDRKYANLLLFTEEIYIDRSGNEIAVGGSIVEAAYIVADHFLNSGVDVHYAGNDVSGATNNGRSCIYSNIQGSWDLPVEQPQRYGVVCATFVSLAIWQAGLIDEETINQYGYNACSGVDSMLTTSKYKDDWEIITSWDELQEGDIVYMKGHVFIFMEGEKCLDQNYCVITSGGTDYRGSLINASKYRSDFIRGYRYIG